MGEYTVYVLRSLRDHQLYIGMTEDLKGRLKKHENGGVRSTKHRRPLIVVYAEPCSTRDEARRREKYLKSGPGHRYLAEVAAVILDASRLKRPDGKRQDKSG